MQNESADLEVAAAQYSVALLDIVVSPPVLDHVDLGPGPDGYTVAATIELLGRGDS